MSDTDLKKVLDLVSSTFLQLNILTRRLVTDEQVFSMWVIELWGLWIIKMAE